MVLWTESLNPAVFEILRFKRIGVTSLTFQGHVTSSVTWLFDSSYAISYWWSSGTKPLSLTVSEIFNVECYAMVNWHDLDTTSKQRSRSFILVPIDFSYTTSYRLCSKMHRLARILSSYRRRQTSTTDARNTVPLPIARPAKNQTIRQWRCRGNFLELFALSDSSSTLIFLVRYRK